MLEQWLADLVLVVHFGFVIFVSAGGFLVLVRPWWAALHVPCLLYGVGVELIGWTCPLTPLEQRLRLRAGADGYSGGFIDHYVGGALYPDDWATLRVWLGLFLVTLNLAVYAIVVSRRLRSPCTG